MSDVVAVSLITGAASLLGAGIGALTTYKVSVRNASATVATADSQNKVELERIAAENRRLHTELEAEERRHRQATYHRTITAMEQMYGAELKSDDVADLAAEWRQCRAGVRLFGSEAASSALDRVQELVHTWPGEDMAQWQHEFMTAGDAFITAVREDIGGKSDERR
jgi:NAD(P)-dependent dehydrogenase (short-subunit alcohol dehydrogenase family)